MAEIDNFKIIRNLLEFRLNTDRYVLHILRRPKDCKSEGFENTLGSNEKQRLLRTYYINSVDYFDSKETAVKELCRINNARAYIIPQVRNNKTCMTNLLRITIDNLENPTIKPEHLIRAAYCGKGSTTGIDKDRKRWVVDIDSDNMQGFSVSSIRMAIYDSLAKSKRGDAAVYELPTKNGMHFITQPFDVKYASSKCFMLFSDTKSGIDRELAADFLKEHKWNDDIISSIPENPFEIEGFFINLLKKNSIPVNTLLGQFRERCKKTFTGWLHKTGMTLLYTTKENT